MHVLILGEGILLHHHVWRLLKNHGVLRLWLLLRQHLQLLHVLLLRRVLRLLLLCHAAMRAIPSLHCRSRLALLGLLMTPHNTLAMLRGMQRMVVYRCLPVLCVLASMRWHIPMLHMLRCHS